MALRSSSLTRGAVCTAALAILLAGGAAWMASRTVPTSSGALPQEAYLWQRQWTEPVRAAAQVADSDGSPLGGLCVAYAEIAPGSGAPPEVRRSAGVDWALLARCRRPVGFAVRVRTFGGEVDAGREPFPTLRRVIGELCVEANAAGVRRAEVQVDFDCPTSRLRGLAQWLRALRAAYPGERFTFTALPAWLRSRDFPPLAAVTGGYVLQLHWLEPPGANGLPPRTLCDPARARSAVAQAARLGVPFRAALPTYSYRLVLDGEGRLLAGAGEGSALEAARPPPGGAVRTLAADPGEMAELVRGWQARRPAALRGVIWYRLPVAGDRLNWTARTLWAVAAGRVPRPALALRFESPAKGAGPCELRLCNDGEADTRLPASITVRCASEPLAADGVGGFALEKSGFSLQELVFNPRNLPGEPTRTLPAGSSLIFGWVRLAAGPEDGPPLTGSMIPPDP